MDTRIWGVISLIAISIVASCSDDDPAASDVAQGDTASDAAQGDSANEVPPETSVDIATDASEDSAPNAHGDVDPDASNVCGPAPWVKTTVLVTEWSSSPPKPIAGVQGTFSTCPGKVFVSDDKGVLSGYSTRAVLVWGKVAAPGYVTMSGPELLLTEDMEGVDWMLPEAMLAAVPSWSEDAPTMLVIIATDPATEAASPCASPDGVVVSIEDHPEAVVTYYEAGPIPLPSASLTATSAAGVAIVSGLRAGTTVEPVAIKPGCTATFKVTFHTGRYPLEAGVLSRAGALLTE